MISTGFQRKIDMDKKPGFTFKGKQAEYDAFWTSRITRAREQREQRYREFNGLTFLEDDEANLQLRDSYLRPKNNPDEVRINSGTVEKKVITVVNEMLNLNMNHEITAFDLEDKEVVELGEVIGDVVKRTNEQELDDDLKFPIIWDLLTRRIAYVEEYLDERELRGKRVVKAKKRLIDPQKVFVADITMRPSRFNEQPYIIVYERMSYDMAETIYGDWKNWQYVKAGMPKDNTWYDGRFNWRMAQDIPGNDVEVIKCMSAQDNEYYVRINGVPMTKIGEKLPWDHDGYNMTCMVYRETGDFHYGQLFTVEAKIFAGIKDEMLRLMFRKFKQAIEPPLGTVKKGLNRDAFEPGAVTEGIGPNDFGSLITHSGVTDSEFAMLEMISNQIEQEIGVSKMMQGVSDKKLTATQTNEQMKQAMKAIGMAILSWSGMVRNYTYLRVYNTIENLTKPVDYQLTDKGIQKLYTKFTLRNGTFEDEKTGVKRIEFIDSQTEVPSPEQLHEEEDRQSEVGKPIRTKYVNVEALTQIPYIWYVNVTSQEKDSSALNKVMFQDYLKQTADISVVTKRTPNPDRIIEKFERTWKEKDTFLQEQPNKQPQPGEEDQGGGQGQPGQGTDHGANPNQKAGIQDMLKKLDALKQSKTGAQMQSGMKSGTSRPGVKQIMATA